MTTSRYTLTLTPDDATIDPITEHVADYGNTGEILYAHITALVAAFADCDNEGAEGEETAELVSRWTATAGFDDGRAFTFAGGILNVHRTAP